MTGNNKYHPDPSFSQLDLWGNKHEVQLEDFKVAREYVRSLKLKSQTDWDKVVKSGKLKGIHIPAHPDRVYKNHGWKNWDDWLGTEDPPEPEKQSSSNVFAAPAGENLWSSTVKSKWMNFFEARQVVREYGFEYQEEWELLINGKFPEREPLPDHIPGNPDQVYSHVGWKDWKDWLMHTDKQISYTEFYKSRDFVRSNRIADKGSWRNFLKVNTRLIIDYQMVLPERPHLEYRDSGWKSWEDWLGNEISYRDFKSTKKYIHSLKLKNRQEWQAFCQGQITHIPKRTANIFAYPEIAYRDEGWKDWNDWLGTARTEEVASTPPETHEIIIDCKCKGRIEHCPDCDGKGYYTVRLS
ncbi:MAG: hypothetical protein ISS19_04325 [Bacteroidales bacterium]|nr:hypothetical protein [Bacteroidales bacterium]